MEVKSCRLVSLFVALAMSCAIAKAQQAASAPANYPRFEAVDIGTLGGPSSDTATFAPVVNHHGTLGGISNTAELTDCTTVNALNIFNCNVAHAIRWSNGKLVDLGTLGGNNSGGFDINDKGDIAGGAETALVDPVTGQPVSHATLWRGTVATDLGTLGGTQSLAFAINNRGQVAGGATNNIPDQFSLNPIIGNVFLSTTQTHAFLWDHGVMRDLGTLGGPDSFGDFINQDGVVAGLSMTSEVPSPILPPTHGFVWKDGTMFDVGTFGGNFSNINALNNKGQAVGLSDTLGGASTKAFLWDRGVLRDLGDLGGDFSEALWISDAGDVVGLSFLAGDQTFHAFVWRDGQMRDLGVLKPGDCSSAITVNSAHQLAGISGGCSFFAPRAFFVQGDGPMVDIESLIVRGPSDLTIFNIAYINERGEVVTLALTPSGDFHVVLLTPTSDVGGDGHDHRSRASDADRARAADHLRIHPKRMLDISRY